MNDYCVIHVPSDSNGRGIIVAAGLSCAKAHEIVRADRDECVRAHSSLRYPNGAMLDSDPIALIGQQVGDKDIVAADRLKNARGQGLDRGFDGRGVAGSSFDGPMPGFYPGY